MSPVEWAMRPLKKYATFSGRAPRAEYWWFYLAYILLAVLLQILSSIHALFGLLGILYLALIIPMLAVGVRRLHDINRTGWWLLAPFVPYLIGFAIAAPALLSSGGNVLAAQAGLGSAAIFFLIGGILAIVLLVFTVLPGTKGPNRYGPDPYEEQNLGEVFA